ncbi:hypothetical protein BCEP4_2020002 [Burkholderia cepacia]|nr:hypothetical protein BCEP4_2020002 [Burkholderia cepacia]
MKPGERIAKGRGAGSNHMSDW